MTKQSFYILFFLLLVIASGAKQSYAQTLKETDLYLVRGDSRTFVLTTYGDVTADELLFVVKKDTAIASQRLIQKQNTVAGGSVDEIETSYRAPFTKITVKFIPLDTEDLLRNKYVFDLTRTDPDDSTDHTHLFIGYLNLQPTIATPGDGASVPLDGTRFYFVGLDSSNKKMGIALFDDETNQVYFINFVEAGDSIKIIRNLETRFENDSTANADTNATFRSKLNSIPSQRDDALRDYLLGSKIQNFLSKANNSQRPYEDTISVRMMGNSISSQTASWGMFSRDSLLLTQLYPDVIWDIQNASYGGYNVLDHHVKYFEDLAINPNIDLFIFAEFEGNTNNYLNVTRNIIKRIREKSTTDIIIQTWNPKTDVYVGEGMKGLRDIASEFNCELLDTYEAFLDTVAAGTPLSELLLDAVHPDSSGHAIYYELFKLAVDTANYNKHYSANPFDDVETIYELEEPILYIDSSRIKPYGTWNMQEYSSGHSGSSYVIYNDTQNDSLVIEFEGVGFDLFYFDSTGFGEFNLKIDDKNPSDIRINSFPLVYASPVLWDENNSNADHTHRLFKAIPIDTTEGGEVIIEVVDATNDSVIVYRTSHEGGNLLSNNSFETYSGTQDDGTTDTFTNWTNAVATGGRIEATATSNSGANAIKMYRDASNSTIRQAENVSEGEQYIYRFYTRGDGTNAGRYLIYDLTNAATIINESTNIPGTTYTFFADTFTIPAGCMQITVYCSTPNANDCYAYFDDVELVLYSTDYDTLGAGNWNEDITAGDIYIPKKYGGRDNWIGEEDFVNGDKFTFMIYNNWVNEVSTAHTYGIKRLRIFGLENTSHKLTLTNQSGGKILLDAIKIFRPKLGRQ